MEIREIEINRIDVVAGRNPRIRIDNDYSENLGRWMLRDGQDSPVSVVQRGDRYELIDGECRLRGAVQAGMQALRAKIYTSVSESDILCIALRQNLLQSTLADEEIGITLKKIRDGYGWSHERIATSLGKRQHWVSDKISLVERNSPNIIALVSGRRLKFSQALALARLPHEEQDMAVLEVMRCNMTHKLTKEYVRQLLGEDPNRNHDTATLVSELRHIVSIVKTITERHIDNQNPLPKAVADDLIALNHELLSACSMMGVLVRSL